MSLTNSVRTCCKDLKSNKSNTPMRSYTNQIICPEITKEQKPYNIRHDF